MHRGIITPLPTRIDRRGRASARHRSGTAGLVLKAWRQAGFSSLRSWLRRHPTRYTGRTQAHRIPTQTAGYRGRNTRAGARQGQADYWESACGFGRDATLWMLEQGVRIVGTDSYSWDPAFKYVIERFNKSKDPAILWEGHKAGREIGYFQMEKLTNLDQLPSHGFTISCFPIKIKDASAGWCRTVAILE